MSLNELYSTHHARIVVDPIVCAAVAVGLKFSGVSGRQMNAERNRCDSKELAVTMKSLLRLSMTELKNEKTRSWMLTVTDSFAQSENDRDIAPEVCGHWCGSRSDDVRMFAKSRLCSRNPHVQLPFPPPVR